MDRRVRWCGGIAVALCLGLTGIAQAAAPAQLTVGDRALPLNIEGTPQFGWMPTSEKGNDVQTAYQLTVSKAGGAAVWDSGKVASSAQSYVPYDGPALENGAAYEWTVRTWDRDGEVSPAATGHFDTGLTDFGWSGAQWIRRVTVGNDATDDYTLARKQFPALGTSPVTRARVYASAMGQYEVHVNGRTIGRGHSFNYPGEGEYQAWDITDRVQAGQPLALGAMYHYWTCTCQGRANGPLSNTTLSAAQAAAATNLRVASVAAFDVGDQITVGTGATAETATVTEIGTAGAGGTGITVAPALQVAHASGQAVRSHSGPSGLLVKAVIDHADGSRETLVSDGTWKTTKATQYTNATLTNRNGDSGDRLERYDARLEIPGWDAAGFDDTAWESAYVIGAHPRPVNQLRDTFSHLDPNLNGLEFKTVHPKSIRTLADGTVVADFGVVIAAAPRVAFKTGVAGRLISMHTSFRLNNTTLASPSAVGDPVIKVAGVGNFQVGDRITVDAPANGKGAGDPEVATIVAVGTAGAGGTGITLDTPLVRAHAAGRWVEGSRTGTTNLDTQGSNLSWFHTQKDGPQTAEAFTHWGWRYLQITGGAGEPLTADDISAVVQHADAPSDRWSTFESDNETLDEVFKLMQRSGVYSSQETFVDTPTREKGQFTGDTVAISFANMISAGDRNPTARAIREILYSGRHAWKAAGSGFCTAAQVPCSYASIGTPGRVNSVYPNGDNMRDIPDYTLMVPDWVWRYYEQSGDRATLAQSYASIKNIAEYVRRSMPALGGASGLVYQLVGGSGSYANGIIDWGPPMRYGYTFTNNGARTIHNAEAVGTFRAAARAGRELGHIDEAAQFDQWADALSVTINEKLSRPDGLYTDGLSTSAGNPQIDATAQHALTYPIYYGVAPQSRLETLASKIIEQGMRQGPMTWHKLLKALTIAGKYDQVVKLLTDRTSDGPAKILAQNGTFMWELWSPGCAPSPCSSPTESSSESFSHGWGAWGIVDVIESLLGVSVTSPGAATVRIAPPAVQTADLNRASGSAWTQRGTVGVSWKKVAGTYVLDVDVPANVKATVAIPNPDGRKYVGVGAGAPQLVGNENGRAVFTVGSGPTHFSIGAEAPGDVGGTVPPTLSLTLGTPAGFGAFLPGVAGVYDASTTANVISTAGDAALTVTDPSSVFPGRLVNGSFALPQPLQVAGSPLPAVVKTWAGPVSNDAFSIPFKQTIGANDALRTGTYSKTLTFTLSTTTP